MAALKDWYRKCFRRPVLPGEEGKVVKRLELYYGMCEIAKAVMAEYGIKPDSPVIREYALRRAFRREWRGKPISCFVTDLRASCNVGERRRHFACLTRPAAST
ncbi:MAG: PaRep2a protein [Pyrobaculum aerophilum]|nr:MULTISPECIES: PaRep2a protein [Pyrobaculum]MCX8136490.1 PaRep2a protein [Pyrobaculum aerophilum]